MGANATSGLPDYGDWDTVISLKLALIAFANGLVLEPPATRAPHQYVVLLADECREPSVEVDAQCTAPYALNLTRDMFLGRRDRTGAGRYAIPPVRGVIGGVRFTQFLAATAGSLGIPNIGFAAQESVLSDKTIYPFYTRTNPTNAVVFKALTELMLYFRYTHADALFCNVDGGQDWVNPLLKLFGEHGINGVAVALRPDSYSLWPAGHDFDYPDGIPDPEVSRTKKEHWDTVIAGMLTRNAHVHISLVKRQCPEFDFLHYAAMHGLAGTGHLWMYFNFFPATYEDQYIFALNMLSYTYTNGTLTPYMDFKPLDGVLSVTSFVNQDSAELTEFWELVRYMGQNQEQFLEPWLQNQIPASNFNRNGRSWEDALAIFDAAFTLLLAINDLLLSVGPAFTGNQLLARIRSSSFHGLTGPMIFDEVGDRVIKMVFQQYNLDPEVKKLTMDVKGSTRDVGSYLYNLTIFADLVFYGGSTTLPPDKDLECGLGMKYIRTTGKCEECTPGTYAPRGNMAFCEECHQGSYAAAYRSDSCTPCNVGFHASNFSSTACTACAPGTYNGAIQQSACMKCDVGTYAPMNSSKCQLCPRNTYASTQGNAECTRCDASLITRDIGSTSPADCVCPAGTYRSARERNACLECPSGMECGVGSDELMLARYLAGDCLLEGECVFPHAGQGFMALRSEPLRPFACVSTHACPGGPPGCMDELYDDGKVACAWCAEGAYMAEGRCRECGGGLDVVMLIVVCVACILALVGFVFAINRDMILQSSAMLTTAVVFGITLTSLQTMGVFSSLALDWFDPLKQIFGWLKFLSFNLETLKLSCVFRPDSETKFLCAQLVPPMIACLIVVVVLFKKRFVRPDVVVSVEAVNSIGTIFSALFISMTTSAALPLVCYRHPDGSESMLGEPSVLCWEAGEHAVTVWIGCASFVGSVLPFIALVLHGTIKYPSFVAASAMGNARGLTAFRFLFFRFRCESFFYGSILMSRSLAICLVPVVVRHDMAFQVCIISFFLLAGNVVQLQLQPWRSQLANVIDGVMTSGLILFLISGTASSDFVAEKESIRLLGTLIFAAFLSSFLGAVGWGIWKRFHPVPWFRWFICHHKRDAAAAARMLKIVILQRGQSCFIDSDDLQDLDTLFDIVRTSLEHLVVYLTREVLTRPWCAGEITTATRKGLKITCVEIPGFVAPEESSLDNLSAYLDLTSTTLSQYSISFEAIAAAYRRLLSRAVPWVVMPTALPGRAKFLRVAEQLLGKGQTELTQAAKPGCLVVSSDPADDEASAAAGILISKIQGEAFGFMAEGIFMLADEKDLLTGTLDISSMIMRARALVVVLSRGSLECQSQLRAIITGMGKLSCASKSQEFKKLQEFKGKGSGASKTVPRGNSDSSVGAARYEVIPVSAPSFQFPPPDFFEAVLPRIWQGAEEEHLSVKTFFKRLAVCLSTHASDAVLQSQASQVVGRIPRRYVASLDQAGMQAQPGEAYGADHVAYDSTQEEDEIFSEGGCSV